MRASNAIPGIGMDFKGAFGRAAVGAVAVAVIMAGSGGVAEAQRRVLEGIGIGIGTAIILNEVLNSGEDKEKRGRAKAAPAPTSSAPRVSGDAERIRALQTALVAHGYDAGSADGVWGNKARTATVQFQRDLGQAETGTLTGEQIILLRDATSGRIAQRVTSRLDQAAAIADEGGLRSDSDPEEIRLMQSSLTQMGFYKGAMDGAWGPSVEQAVTRYQRHEGAPTNGRLTQDQSDRIIGRPVAHAQEPPVRVMSVRPTGAAPAARDDGAGLRFRDLPADVQTHVSAIRASCKAAFEDVPLDHRKGVKYLPDDEMQGIQQVSLEGSPAIMVDNLQLCADQIPAANCSNRGCDLAIWQFDNSGAWRQEFKEHLHSRELDIDPATKQLRSMSVAVHAGDSRCAPAAGRTYTSGESCKLNVTYSGGQWRFAREQSQ